MLTSSNKMIVALLGTVLFCSVSSVAVSGQLWFLMARHGECTGIEVLKRKIPDLGIINDPYSFVMLMHQKGLDVTSTEMASATGLAIEVKVPAKELSLVFVTSELCQNSGTR